MADADVSMKVGMTDELASELKMAREMGRKRLLVTLAAGLASCPDNYSIADVPELASGLLAAIEKAEAGR